MTDIAPALRALRDQPELVHADEWPGALDRPGRGGSLLVVDRCLGCARSERRARPPSPSRAHLCGTNRCNEVAVRQGARLDAQGSYPRQPLARPSERLNLQAHPGRRSLPVVGTGAPRTQKLSPSSEATLHRTCDLTRSTSRLRSFRPRTEVRWEHRARGVGGIESATESAGRRFLASPSEAFGIERLTISSGRAATTEEAVEAHLGAPSRRRSDDAGPLGLRRYRS